MAHPYNRGQPRRAIESEMDRFEREISSIAVPPAPGQGPPPRNSFIPAQLRRPVPPPPPAPPGTVPVRPPISLAPVLRPSPVIISGAPQVYSANSKMFKPTVTSISAGPRPTLGKSREAGSTVPSTVSASKAQEGAVPHGKQEDISSTAVSSNSSSTGPSDGPGSGVVGAGGPGSSQAAPSSSSDLAKPSSSNSESLEKKKKKKKKKKLEGVEKKPRKALRSAGGQIWEDQTLQDWDPSDFRLFCGDLGNDVTDEVLTRVFGRYPSFQKAKVVRDKRSNKTKGFGFVSFKDPNDFVRAIKELDGRYVGSRPIKLRKSNWRNRNLDQARKKEKERTQILAQMKKT